MSKIKNFFANIGSILIYSLTLLSPFLLILLNLIGVLPIFYFDFPFRWLVAALLATVFMFIGGFSRIPIIILYVVGLIHVINMPQDWTSIVYYVLFGCVVVFEIIPFIIGFFSPKDK